MAHAAAFRPTGSASSSARNKRSASSLPMMPGANGGSSAVAFFFAPSPSPPPGCSFAANVFLGAFGDDDDVSSSIHSSVVVVVVVVVQPIIQKATAPKPKDKPTQPSFFIVKARFPFKKAASSLRRPSVMMDVCCSCDARARRRERNVFSALAHACSDRLRVSSLRVRVLRAREIPKQQARVIRYVDGGRAIWCSSSVPVPVPTK
jgi:hypothetical protein